jgi:hypothetical protein
MWADAAAEFVGSAVMGEFELLESGLAPLADALDPSLEADSAKLPVEGDDRDLLLTPGVASERVGPMLAIPDGEVVGIVWPGQCPPEKV